MDVVITYVDGQDPLWREDYARFVGKKMLGKRFRDWGTLPYLFRALERNLPFVRKVHLLVARESQVPSWINRSEVDVVLHSDIIPPEHLPLFNASSIEMFLHLIPDLDEEFIYLNDDCFPVLPLLERDFFRDGKAVNWMKRQLLVLGNPFRYMTRRASNFARDAAALAPSPFYVRQQHTAAPMLRSSSEELFNCRSEEILSTLSRVREPQNYNQYIFVDYMYFKGRTFRKKISNRHFSLAVANVDKICRFIADPDRAFVCINDVEMSDEKFAASRSRILAAFDSVFPQKSRFEL